jgi:hypothetical protein
MIELSKHGTLSCHGGRKEFADRTVSIDRKAVSSAIGGGTAQASAAGGYKARLARARGQISRPRLFGLARSF